MNVVSAQHGRRDKVICGGHCVAAQVTGESMAVQRQTHRPSHPCITQGLRGVRSIQHHPEVVGLQERDVKMLQRAFEGWPKRPGLVEQGLHVRGMKATHEIVTPLGQSETFCTHVLDHIHVHGVEVGQRLAVFVLLPIPLVAVQHETGIRHPPSQLKRPRTCRIVAQIVALFGRGFVVDDASVRRRQQPQKRRIRLSETNLHRAVVQCDNALRAHRIQNPPARRHHFGVAQPLQRIDHVVGLNGTPGREHRIPAQLKLVSQPFFVKRPRLGKARSHRQVRPQLHQPIVQLIDHPHVLQTACSRGIEAGDGCAFVVAKHPRILKRRGRGATREKNRAPRGEPERFGIVFHSAPRYAGYFCAPSLRHDIASTI